ncbi:MAG TPA: alkaline phosphatase family protein [Pirellulales bacterium]|jgi:hypothetical protein|nr:alkaline phosphatase family protein [Pirellulales bacterium]
MQSKQYNPRLRSWLSAGCAALGLALSVLGPLSSRVQAAAGIPAYDHVVVVIEENEAAAQIIGNSTLPYINYLATNGANFTNSYALQHPSEPNYLDLFSGSNQGVNDDGAYTLTTAFTTANLGAELIAGGKTFGGYAQGLPSSALGQGDVYPYARKHVPWVNWQGTGTNQIPQADNMPFTSFPNSANYATLPTVSFVIPDLLNDMHDGSPQTADTWLNTNLSAYATWAKTHNSLLIVTWDEDDSNHGNIIPTIFYGDHINTGNYSEIINHYSVLRTLEDMYNLPYAGASAVNGPITDVFSTPTPEPASWVLFGCGAAALGVVGWRRRRSSNPAEVPVAA